MDDNAPKSPYVMFNALRLVAAIAVIWDHSVRSSPSLLNRWQNVGRFGVPLFTVASIFFLFQSLSRKKVSWRSYSWHRIERIVIPFCIWNAVYFFIKNGENFWAGRAPLAVTPSVLFWGAQAHLWFMPFIFVLGFLAFGVGRSILGHTRREWWTACLCLGAAPLLAHFADHLQTDDWHKIQVLMQAPSLFTGIALAIFYRRASPLIVRSPWLSLLVLGSALITASWSIGWVTVHGRSAFYENLAGLALFVVGLSRWSPHLAQRAASLGVLSYGIYLSHEVFLGFFKLIAAVMHWRGDPRWDLVIFIVTVASTLSAVTIYARLNHRLPAFLHGLRWQA